MVFTSGIIIAFFCFAFYLIWSQFLKKDTRLSIGLQVLRKKITDLENLSLTVEAQVDRQAALVNEKIHRLEFLLKKAGRLCEQMEENIETAHALQNPDLSPPERKIHKENIKKPLKETPPAGKHISNNKNEKENLLGTKQPVSFYPLKSSFSHLKMVKENPSSSSEKQKKFRFGESPFTNLDFVESPDKNNLDSSP